jgi:hypothetical protein
MEYNLRQKNLLLVIGTEGCLIKLVQLVAGYQRNYFDPLDFIISPNLKYVYCF